MALDIEEVFGFHPATPITGPIHNELRDLCKTLAYHLEAHLPESREKSLALTHLQETMMFSNAAIAIHGPREGHQPAEGSPKPKPALGHHPAG